jgi:hypothetical protein
MPRSWTQDHLRRGRACEGEQRQIVVKPDSIVTRMRVGTPSVPERFAEWEPIRHQSRLARWRLLERIMSTAIKSWY